ncbi:tail fiber domain-containing protein [Chryseobacterium sp. OV279]|uniref:tail fiber domain-containing protein n=1 Tax=Chryseobacterium sp. OV279 TaxID=1500285 RepID=UPI000918C860|nr:tail fiber domain-containing protein [Chryseobacterium sp. OV279]SHG23960.1 Chaperone of endosialidase [Chryseobacterium sp. OV279]
MRKIILPLVIAVTSLSVHVNAQVGVNTQTPASTLDVRAKETTGTSAVVEGLLIPRVDRQKAQSMTGVPVSTMIYINSTATGAQTGTAANIDAEGYYYFNGTAWTKLAGNATPANNIYTNDGTLAGNRIVTQGANTLAFTGTAVNAFSVDGGTLSVDAANHRLGIGTTSPSTNLHIVTTGTGGTGVFTANTANTALRLENTGNGQSVIQNLLAKDATGSTKGTVLGINPNYTGNNGLFYLGRNGGAVDFGMDLANGNFGMGANPNATQKLAVGGNFSASGTVGVGTNTAGTALDVNGAITNRETTVAVTGNAATVVANTSQVQLTGAATANITVTAPTAPNAGQRLIIYNNTTGGFPAVLNSTLVPSGQALEFVYSNNDWRASNGGAVAVAANTNWLTLGNTGTNPTNNFIGTTDNTGFVIRTNNTERVRVNQAGNVGIGIANPTVPLQFSNAAASRKIVFYDNNHNNDHEYFGFGLNASVLRYQTDATTADHVFYAAASSTASNELMRIKGNGNIGIGTATPQRTLHVTGSTQLTGELNVGGSATAAGSAGTAGQLLTSGGAGAAPTWTNVTDINTNIYTNDGALNGNRTVTQAANALAFTGTGNVGLGVANPAQKLSVVDGTNANQYFGIASFLPANSTQGVGIGWAGIRKVGSIVNSDFNIDAGGTGNILLQTLATGNTIIGTRLGIGITTPHAPLHIGGGTANRKIILYEVANTETDFYGFGVNDFTLRYQSQANHVFFAGATEIFRINGNGNATLAGSLTQNSDIRLKKDIVDNTYGLSEISKLRTINYRFKDEQRGTDKKIGFIAQEIKAAMPELVSTANDEMKTLSVSYPEMTVVLTKAVQELQELVKSQQKQIDELKAQIKPKP